MRVLILGIILLISTPAIAYCPHMYSYVSGTNKICVYKCIEGERAITIDALDDCPLSL